MSNDDSSRGEQAFPEQEVLVSLSARGWMPRGAAHVTDPEDTIFSLNGLFLLFHVQQLRQGKRIRPEDKEEERGKHDLSVCTDKQRYTPGVPINIITHGRGSNGVTTRRGREQRIFLAKGRREIKQEGARDIARSVRSVILLLG